MANYAKERAKFGGMVGSIQVFTNTLPASNDPTAGEFRTQLPAGFLRCDGSVLRENLYPELARTLGTGQDCKFKKEGVDLEDNEFQLPDIGSKYIVPGRGSGTYLSTFLSDDTTRHVGAEFEVISNVGNTGSVTWDGDFRINSRSGDVDGDPLYAIDEETFTGFITDRHFQAHGHLANQTVLNCTGNYEVSSAQGPEQSGNSHSGNNCKPYGGNLLYLINRPEGSSSLSAAHTHRIQAPTSTSAYTHNFDYTLNETLLDTRNLRTEVNIATSTVTTFDQTVQPFIIVEYIIKF